MASEILNKSDKYKLLPPDGGYAHVINIAATPILTITLAPISSFALIFGPYLSQYHDETSSITIVTSVYVSLLHLTGLLANCFLQKLSYRTVALIGAVLHFSGNVMSIFTVDLIFLTVSYGVIQGLGAGLLIPSSLSAINAYYNVKKPTAMAIGQTMVALLSSAYPEFTRILLENYGFRGTQAIFTAINLHIVVGSLLLQPVEKHLKRKSIVDDMVAAIASEVQHFLDCSENHLSCPSRVNLVETNSSTSNIVIQNNEEDEEEINNIKILDCTVLKDAWYWNISIGLAVSFISETNFMAI
ncbi:monocarboxylate transporter 13-like [Agrilus planipennis]|uniref:Monocarboxylate transporter 13-like n=1 Tax=Agrilus planipennis TaxID=224129 RepID=A0A7F5R0Y2_AGRPL|nr:monocarboxylate transporter 13-like [Agrilus planipennis]